MVAVVGPADPVEPQAQAVLAPGTLIVSSGGDVYEIAPSGQVGGGTPTQVASDVAQPIGVATDAAGDVFMTDDANNDVVELPADGGSEITIGASAGMNSPGGIAVDAAGDVFVADTENNRVVEFPVNGRQLEAYGGTITNPSGLAIDAQGNLFVASTNAVGTVVELPADSPNSPITTNVNDGLEDPEGVAVDPQGDLYVTSRANDSLYKFTDYPKVGITGSPILINSGLVNPVGVTVDAEGDIFVADLGVLQVGQENHIANGEIVEFPASGSLMESEHGIGVPNNEPFYLTVYQPPPPGPAGGLLVAESGSDTDPGCVVLIPPGGGLVTTVGTGLQGSFECDRRPVRQHLHCRCSGARCR